MVAITPCEGGSEAKVIFERLFTPRKRSSAGQDLYLQAARQARRPVFYTSLGVADSGEGRFELYCLHVALVLLRMKGKGAAAAETAQALFDAFVSALDDALREMGVGDISVGKKMRKLGEAFYGRLRSYDEALVPMSDRPALEALLTRTVFEGREDAAAGLLADYVVRALEGLEQTPLDDLLAARALPWPEPVT